ncbi:MAG: hypothetical protein Q4F72_02800 [Desulfovibrionaceae bacterium]|nr:hypothetical protein [Desulfovibrionaceae bacterium]
MHRIELTDEDLGRTNAELARRYRCSVRTIGRARRRRRMALQSGQADRPGEGRPAEPAEARFLYFATPLAEQLLAQAVGDVPMGWEPCKTMVLLKNGAATLQ